MSFVPSQLRELWQDLAIVAGSTRLNLGVPITNAGVQRPQRPDPRMH
jgi:hypothetical protein